MNGKFSILWWPKRQDELAVPSPNLKDNLMRDSDRSTRPAWMLVGLLVTLDCGGLHSADAPKGERPSAGTARPMVAAEGDDELRKLQVARYNALVAEIQDRAKGQPNPLGYPTSDEIRRMVVAWTALDPAVEVPLREELVEALRREERFYEKAVKDGNTPPWTLEQRRYARLDAEIELLMAKRKGGGKK